MKTAISLPDDVFSEAEELAQVQQVSRSSLYAAALREYLARHAPERVTTALDAVYAAEEGRLEADLAQAAAKVLERTEW